MWLKKFLDKKSCWLGQVNDEEFSISSFLPRMIGYFCSFSLFSMGDIALKSSQEVRAWVGTQREILDQKQRDAVVEILNDVRAAHGWLTHEALTNSQHGVLKRLRSELRDHQVIAAATYDKLAKRLEALFS